jgi:hypothetical protein
MILGNIDALYPLNGCYTFQSALKYCKKIRLDKEGDDWDGDHPLKIEIYAQ